MQYKCVILWKKNIVKSQINQTYTILSCTKAQFLLRLLSPIYPFAFWSSTIISWIYKNHFISNILLTFLLHIFSCIFLLPKYFYWIFTFFITVSILPSIGFCNMITWTYRPMKLFSTGNDDFWTVNWWSQMQSTSPYQESTNQTLADSAWMLIIYTREPSVNVKISLCLNSYCHIRLLTWNTECLLCNYH